MAKKNEVAVPTKDFWAPYIAMAGGGLAVADIDEATAAFNEETKDLPKTHERQVARIRIDHDESVFVMGEAELGREIEGVVLHYTQDRKWFEHDWEPGTKDKPDCHSLDMIEPDADSKSPQSPQCATCPQSQWGSGKNNAQACTVTTRLYLLNKNFDPVGIAAVEFGPSSIKSILGSPRDGGGYLNACKRFKEKIGVDPNGDAIYTAEAKAYQLVWGRLALQKGESKARIMVGEPLRRVRTKEEATAIAAITRALLKELSVHAAERKTVPIVDQNEV